MYWSMLSGLVVLSVGWDVDVVDVDVVDVDVVDVVVFESSGGGGWGGIAGIVLLGDLELGSFKNERLLLLLAFRVLSEY